MLAARAPSQFHSKKKTKGPRNFQGEEVKPGVAKEMVRVDKHVSSQNEEPSVNILAHSDLQKKILLLSGLHQHPPAERQSSSPLSLKKKNPEGRDFGSAG